MPHRTVMSDEQAIEAMNRNVNGEFLFPLATKYGVSHQTLLNAIVRVGGTPIKHKQNGAKPTISGDIQRALAKEYIEGKTIAELQEKYSLGRKAVQNAIGREGVEFRPQGTGPKQFTDEEKDKMVELYLDGLSSTEVATQLSTSQFKVSRVLSEKGIELRRRGQNKEWVQRRRVGPGGYVKIKLHKDDEYYPLTSDGAYILEHRYVMMKNLGRPLTDDESVHHIDGDKQNNSIDNLQLRTRFHGKGQTRVCGDCGSHNILTEKL